MKIQKKVCVPPHRTSPRKPERGVKEMVYGVKMKSQDKYLMSFLNVPPGEPLKAAVTVCFSGYHHGFG